MTTSTRCDRTSARSFAREEDGSFILFGLFLFVAMLIVGGVAVDILRHDYARTRMQNAMDNAVLAAADLDQKLDPKAVVNDYLDKAGVASASQNVTVLSAPNSREVSSTAWVDIPTMFMRSVGVDSMGVATGSTAREDIRDVEISLVLDVSGSMGTSKLDKLKTAAKSFVRKLLIAPDGSHIDGRISINIVPYSTQVNAGPTLLDAMRVTDRHPHSNCIDFNSSEYGNANMSSDTSYRQTPYFDPFYENRDSRYDEEHGTQPGSGTPNAEIVCRTDSDSEITLYEDDIGELEDGIDDLWSLGNTSIEIGLKWGAGLLDPAMKDVLAAAGVDSDFSDRPYEYNEENTMKIVVMMTDGANTRSWSLDPAFSGNGDSDVWRWWNGSNWRHSVYRPETSQRNDGDRNAGERFFQVEEWGYSDDPSLSGSATRLSWQDLWSVATIGWNAYWARYRYHYESDRYYYYKNIVEETGPATKNSRQKSLCNDVKSKNIIIFSVAFEISEADAARVKDCASSENHYFNVVGDQLTYAFNSIATTINQLQLTQ